MRLAEVESQLRDSYTLAERGYARAAENDDREMQAHYNGRMDGLATALRIVQDAEQEGGN